MRLAREDRRETVPRVFLVRQDVKVLSAAHEFHWKSTTIWAGRE